MEYYDMLKNWDKFRKFLDGPDLEKFMQLYCSRLRVEYKKNVPIVYLNTKLEPKYMEELGILSDYAIDFVKQHLDKEPYRYCLPHDSPQSNVHLLPGFISELTGKKLNKLYIAHINIIGLTKYGFHCKGGHCVVLDDYVKPGTILPAIEESSIKLYDLIEPMLNSYNVIKKSHVGVISCSTVVEYWNEYDLVECGHYNKFIPEKYL
jgi:hypothetical protein